MSSVSGIAATPELVSAFADAIRNDDVRVFKISIVNETLVNDQTWPKSGDLMHDFERIQTYVEDNVPAYLLVRLDTTPTSEWLAISYVPDTAKVRDKMLYASTQSALKKALGDSRFKDSIFATSKDDLTPDSYAAHLQHMAAPKPRSAREAEMENIRMAEREAGTNTYEGMRVKRSHVAGAMGLKWAQDAEDAVKSLKDADSSESSFVLLSVDPEVEELILAKTSKGVTPKEVASSIFTDAPSFTLYSWPHLNNGEETTSVVLIYTCPPTSLIKQKMVYSAQVNMLVHTAKGWGVPIARRTEISDPQEINDEFLMQELGHSPEASSTSASAGRTAFAKPRGPPRRK
ncbi:Twinfilin-1 [Serendipita sp. 401]|nr:Twinfilin-1 [Serendipita sp. 401]